MKCSGCDRRKGRNGYNVPREDEFFMNGSMHSKVLESIDSLKWFIEEKFICFMLPIKIFFFPFISPRVRVCKGWTRGMHKHFITPAALLGWEGAVGGKCCYQESVTTESFRREARATTATQVEDLILGKLLLSTDNLTHSPGVQLVHALLFNCLLLRVTEKQKKVQGLVSLNSFALSWGSSL